MRPVAPKNGKNILLEKIPFIWKHMSFTWKSVFRNISRYKKRIFMTIFGICGCMSLLLVGYGIKDSIGTIVESQYEDLHKYDLYAKYSTVYNTEEIKVINDYYDSKKEINAYINMYSATSQISTDKKNMSGYIYAIDDVEKFKDFIIFGTGDNIPKLTNDGVVITKKLSILLDVKVGDELELKGANGEEGPKVKITGIAKNYIFHYVYMSKEFYESIYGTDYLYNQALIIQNSDKDLSEELLKNEYITSVSTSKSLRENFENMLEGLDIIILVIIISAGGLAFVVLYNLNNINICERVRELATLKVLGFYDVDVSAYIFRENIILTMVGVLTGCLGGNLLHEFVMDTIEVDMVMFGRNIEFPSYIYATLITLTFAVLINLTMHFKLKKIDMTTSLKSVD
jgi:putative ABC transport system permease protein